MFRIKLTKEFNDHVEAERQNAIATEKAIKEMSADRNRNKEKVYTCIDTEIIQNEIKGLEPFKLKNNWY